MLARVNIRVVWDRRERVCGCTKFRSKMWDGAPFVQFQYEKLRFWIVLQNLGGDMVSLVLPIWFNSHFGSVLRMWLVCSVQFLPLECAVLRGSFELIFMRNVIRWYFCLRGSTGHPYPRANVNLTRYKDQCQLWCI